MSGDLPQSTTLCLTDTNGASPEEGDAPQGATLSQLKKIVYNSVIWPFLQNIFRKHPLSYWF